MNRQKWTQAYISLVFLFITSSSAELLIQQVTEGRGTENNSSYNLTANLGVARMWREERPSNGMVTIAGFCNNTVPREPLLFSVFEAAGYKWRLVLYPDGNKNDGGHGHISLYVRMEETESLPKDWEVNVDLKLFVHNGKLHKYLIVTDGTVKRYTDAKKEWGFGQLIPRSTFCNKTEGYIELDTGSFGAEISIVKPGLRREEVTFIEYPRNRTLTWTIRRYSTLEDKFYYSREVLIADRFWRLGFNPKISKNNLGLFLFAMGYKQNAVVASTFGGAVLTLKNQNRGGTHIWRYAPAWYPIQSGSGNGYGLITLADLNDASKGFLKKDTIIFELDMIRTSVTRIV